MLLGFAQSSTLSRVYKWKRLDIEEHICLYFEIGVQKGEFYWGVPDVPKTMHLKTRIQRFFESYN
jgi:hypothetical protein